MNYSKLKITAESKNYMIKDLAAELGMTSNGLKRSVESNNLTMEKVTMLCKLLDITPNEFFGWDGGVPSFGSGNYASHVSGGNTQNSNEAIQALREELKEQRGVIKEKDRQISRLLGIMERDKKP